MNINRILDAMGSTYRALEDAVVEKDNDEITRLTLDIKSYAELMLRETERMSGPKPVLTAQELLSWLAKS